MQTLSERPLKADLNEGGGEDNDEDEEGRIRAEQEDSIPAIERLCICASLLLCYRPLLRRTHRNGMRQSEVTTHTHTHTTIYFYEIVKEVSKASSWQKHSLFIYKHTYKRMNTNIHTYACMHACLWPDRRFLL